MNPYRWAEFVGFLKHFGDLPDPHKWRFAVQLMRMGQLPPVDTLRRAERLPGFHLQPGAAVQAVALRDGQVVLDTTAGRFDADSLIVGTGFVTDLALRPELTEVSPAIARWRSLRAAHGRAHETSRATPNWVALRVHERVQRLT